MSSLPDGWPIKNKDITLSFTLRILQSTVHGRKLAYARSVCVLHYFSVIKPFLQADCVMVVGMGDDPSLGEFERLLLSIKTTARKELVLLHPDRTIPPGSTRAWLKVRFYDGPVVLRET